MLLSTAVCVGVAAGAPLLWYLRERGRRRTHPMAGGIHADITLPHTAAFELYHNDFSLCSKKVRMCLAELGLPHVAHHIDLIETGHYETLGRRFLAVNPAALVPVLVHDGHPIYESHDILAYAAHHAPAGDRLQPTDPTARALMERWVEKASLFGDDPTTDLTRSAGNCVPGLTLPLFAAMIADIPTWRILEGLLFHRIKTRPAVFLLFKLVGLENLGRVPPVVRVAHASRTQLARHLGELEAQLGSTAGPWILGPQFTLADVSWAVIFDRLREADWTSELLTDDRPAVQAYWRALQSRPSYQAAMDAHVHPLVRRGTDRIRDEKARNVPFRWAIFGG